MTRLANIPNSLPNLGDSSWLWTVPKKRRSPLWLTPQPRSTQ